MLENVLFSFAYVLYSVVIDVLNAGNRHLVPFIWVIGRFWQSTDPAVLAPFQGELLVGIFGTAILPLVFAAVTASGASEGFGWFSIIILTAEGVLQLFGAFTGLYPTSHTFLVVFWVQFSLLPLKWGLQIGQPVAVRYFLLTGGICGALQVQKLYHMDYMGGVLLWSFITVPVLVMGSTPVAFWNMLARRLKALVKVISAAVTWIWLVTQHAWPYVLHAWVFLLAILNSDLALAIQRKIIAPVWRMCSPLLMPAVSAGIAVQCVGSLLTNLAAPDPWSIKLAFQSLMQLFCFLAATNSSIILSTHAIGRIVAPGGIDILRHKVVCLSLNALARLPGAPFQLLQWLAALILRGGMLRRLGDVLKMLKIHAETHPLPAMIEVSLASGFVLWLAYATVLGAVLGRAVSFVIAIFWAILHELGFLATGKRSTDSNLALLVMAFSQAMIYRAVASILVIWSTTFEEDMTTLNEIAGTFADPRQCARCAFGPVDYDGCNYLTTHHGERVRRGGSVSNACPRCNWFARTIDRWPYWNAERQSSDSTRRVIRTRLWSEVVCIVRAASKALIIPYFTLRFFANWPTIGTLFSLGYLIPWFYENARMFRSFYTGGIYDSETDRYPPRNLRDTPTDCRRRPEPLPHVTIDTALEALFNAAPPKIFMEEDTSCPICLEDLGKEAFAAISDPNPANILRSLDPAVVPLPCGHPLHMACAQQMISVVPDWQNRCPLCREPISLTGTISARVFS